MELAPTGEYSPDQSDSHDDTTESKLGKALFSAIRICYTSIGSLVTDVPAMKRSSSPMPHGETGLPAFRWTLPRNRRC